MLPANAKIPSLRPGLAGLRPVFEQKKSQTKSATFSAQNLVVYLVVDQVGVMEFGHNRVA